MYLTMRVIGAVCFPVFKQTPSASPFLTGAFFSLFAQYALGLISFHTCQVRVVQTLCHCSDNVQLYALSPLQESRIAAVKTRIEPCPQPAGAPEVRDTWE